jgi:hypothetical protein
MNKLFIGAIALTVSLCACNAVQKADNSYDTSVKEPFYKSQKPKVLFDEAHFNVHTTKGTYKPFVKLISNDGCIVTPNLQKFSSEILKKYDLLVISNAKGGLHENKGNPAFNDEECNVVEKWVTNGGSLLLIADHFPMGSAAQNLSQKFGVTMSNGEVSDTIYFQGNDKFRDELIFSKTNGLLLSNEITQGQNPKDSVSKVATFRGQSLSIPDSAIIFLKLSSSSLVSTPIGSKTVGDKTYTEFTDPVSAFGSCQGLALKHGKGRVIILGEAAMLTAQKYKDDRFGMNAPSNDNKQLALNIVHWLTKK